MRAIKSYFKIRYHLFRIMLKDWRRSWFNFAFPIVWGLYAIYRHNWLGLCFFVGLFILTTEWSLHRGRQSYEKRRLKQDIIRFFKNQHELEVIEVPVGSI